MACAWPDNGLTDPVKVGRWALMDVATRRLPRGLGVRMGCPTPVNVGILTGEPSGLLVLDIDPRNGGDETLFDLEKEHGELPETVMSLTGSGGWHYYFALPEGFMVPSGPFAQGIDIKANRGYVVGPGSRHGSGYLYEWEVLHHPDDVPLAAPPEWLFKRARTPRSSYPTTNQRVRKATTEQQDEFREMWAKAGITLEGDQDRHYLCVIHKERTPSLHIDPVGARWYCFGCGAGGGLRDLQTLMSQQSVGIPLNPTDHRDIRLLPDFSNWLQPTAPAGGCGGFGQFQEHRTTRGKLRGIHPFCQKWECRRCGPFIKDEWLYSLLDCMMSGTGPVYVALVEPREWEAVRKRIQRDSRGHSDFMRFDFAGAAVPIGRSSSVVITTASAGLEVNRDQARHLLFHLVRALPFDRLRIETSTAWEKTRRVVRKTGEWKVIEDGIGPDLKKVADDLKEEGLHPTRLSTLKSWDLQAWGQGFDVTVPPEIRDSNKFWWLLVGMSA
jgi:hypothetical protein